jgi:prepilin-type processing-associated H-X9-DG protein
MTSDQVPPQLPQQPHAPAGGQPATPLGYSPPPPPGSGTRKVLIIVLACVLGIGLFFCVCVSSILLPSLNRAREQAQRVKCASNLRQIGQAAQLFANDHNGNFPDTAEQLLAHSDLESIVFVCPSSNDTAAPGADSKIQAANLRAGGHLSYVYVGKGLSAVTGPGATGKAIVAYEPLTNHANGGINVLFSDGHVEFFNPQQAQRIVADLQAGKNPTTVAPTR